MSLVLDPGRQVVTVLNNNDNVDQCLMIGGQSVDFGLDVHDTVRIPLTSSHSIIESTIGLRPRNIGLFKPLVLIT